MEVVCRYVNFDREISGVEFGNVPANVEHFTYVGVYTGCPGGNVPDFGRMFVTLKYTDIIQNTYI